MFLTTIGFCVISFLTDAQWRQAGPVVCLEPRVNVGTVWVSDKIEHTFRLYNTSREYVWIQKWSWGAYFPPQRIRPYGYLDIPIQLQTRKIRGRFDKGFKITIVTPNDAHENN